ncbi:HNH endonuclease [Fimbriiglobus ruber]|nr:HNH endonuclease [Fimbriiglobus ruber]
MVDRSRYIKQTDEEIVTAYQTLKSAAKVAKHFGIGGTTVERILKRNKVTRDGRSHYLTTVRAYTPEQEFEIVAKYRNGTWASDLIKEYGGSAYSINQAIDRHGVTKRPNPYPDLTSDQLETIKRLHADGMGQTQISIEIRRSQTFVSHAMKKHGIAPHRPMNYTHGMWKGGKLQSGKYFAVLLDRNDPYYAMARSGGYVMEHRIVMARHLGRPLTPTETVHHINGDSTDNRIENLQLRQGRHGKGAVAYCVDCGSHNIDHKPLPE